MMKKVMITIVIVILIVVGGTPIISAFSAPVNSNTGGNSAPLDLSDARGENLALKDNGGSIILGACRFFDKGELKNNLCIDGNKYTGVSRETIDDMWDTYWGGYEYAQIEIDLAGNYHKLHSIEVDFYIQDWNSYEKVEIQAHKEDGWITIINYYNLQTQNEILIPCKLLQDNKGNLYEINKIRYRLYTDVYVPYVGYYAYGDFSVKEIRAFEWKDEEPPSININRPKTPGVYFQNKKIYPLNEYRIMIGYSTVDVTFSDNIFIKKCEIKAGGLVLFSQNYDLYDEKQTLRLDDIPILEGSNRYRFSVTDFSDNEVNQEINIIGFLIDGPACLLSNPTGIDSGYTNTSYTFSVSAIDFEEDPIEYGWDWDGDGSVDEWTQSDSATYQWTSEGQFEVIVSVKEQNSGRLGLWTTSKTVNIEENTSPTSSDSIQSSQSNTAVPGMSIIPTNPSSTPSVGTTTFQTTSHASNSASSNTMNSGTFLR